MIEIHASDGRDVTTVNLPGAFLQIRMSKSEKVVHVILEKQITELLAKIAPKVYQQCIHHIQGQAYIYCQVNVS